MGVSKEFFEAKTKELFDKINEDLEIDINQLKAYPKSGVQFFSMSDEEKINLEKWLDLSKLLGVITLVGDNHGMTTHLDDELLSKINSVYGHYCIVGIKADVDQITNRLIQRNKININTICDEQQAQVLKSIEMAEKKVVLAKSLSLPVFIMLGLSMLLVFFEATWISLVLSLIMYYCLYKLNKIHKSSLYTMMHGAKNFEENRGTLWDNITQFNERIILESVAKKMN